MKTIAKVRTEAIAKTPWGRRWHDMMSRCYNPDNRDYAYYGGRGIKVCNEWQDRDAYIAYMTEKTGTKYPTRYMTVDRIDNDGDYRPDNVRIISQAEQNRNRSCCYKLTADGMTMTVQEWSEYLGVPASRLYRRRSLGWSDAEIIRGNRTGRAVYGQATA